MIAFAKGVDDHLPVAVQIFADIEAYWNHFLKMVCGEDIGRSAEEVGQGRRLRVRIEEDETAEAFDRHLQQSQIFLPTDELLDRTIEIRTGNRQQMPVETVRPVVIATEETGRVALAAADTVSAMPTGIDEPANDPVLAPDKQIGLIEDRVDFPITAFG